MSVFISGGAGFVGTSLARCYRDKYPTRRIVAFDNLRRRGSELNLRAFKDLDIEFDGIPPDLFKEDSGAVMLGSFDGNGVFVAEEVFAKHDENYMPPELSK